MKKNSSLTVFEKIQQKKRNLQRVIAVVLLLAIVIGVCFGGRLFQEKSEAADEKKEAHEYMSYVMQEMIQDPNRDFTILEIVPDISQGEFHYYCASEHIVDKLNKLRADEIRHWLGDNEYKYVNIYGENTHVYASVKQADGTYAYEGAAVGFLNIMTTVNGITKEPSTVVDNVFLTCVLPEYYTFLKDRLNIRIVEANDVTVLDIRNADLIYLHGYVEGGAQETNQLFTAILDEENRGVKVVEPNYDASGNLLSSANYYRFTDYEYVSFTSQEYLDYQANLAKYKKNEDGKELEVDYVYDSTKKVVNRNFYTKADKEKIALATYPRIKEDANGFYMSRDISWAVVEEMWKVALDGKYFPAGAGDGVGAYATVPLIINGAEILGIDANVAYMTHFIEQISSESTKVSNTATISGYDVFRQCVDSDTEYKAETGLRTGSFCVERFYDKTVKKHHFTEVGAGATLSGRWDTYLHDALKNVTFVDKYMSTYGIDTTEWKKAKDTNKWEAVMLPEIEKILDPLLSFKLGTYSYNKSLRENFFTYNNDLAIMPANKYKKEDLSTFDGAKERLDEDQNYMFEFIRYILRVRGGGSSIDPSNNGGTLALKILEIEPCNDFTYGYVEANATSSQISAARTNVAQLMTDIIDDASRVYQYDSTSGLYIVPGNAKATKYDIEVDCYTINAFNGLTTDIIAEYDIVYVGANSANMGQISSSATVYYPQTATVNSNDFTDVKAQEIRDYVESGKVLMLSTGLTATSIDAGSEAYDMLLDVMTEYNVVFRSSADMINHIYSAAATPMLTMKSVTVDTVETTKTGAEMTYTTVDGIAGVVDGIQTGSGITVKCDVSNCQTGKQYAVVFYIDEDNDGVFGEVESECKKVKVYTAAKIGDTDNYGFTPDSLDITVSSSYISSLIHWKVAVYEVDASTGVELKDTNGNPAKVKLVERDTFVGETPLKASGVAEKAKVKVLQIKGSSGQNFSTDTDLRKYLDAACGAINYEVSIQTVDATDESITVTKVKNEEYDMIVVGTGTYTTLSSEIQSVIKSWVDDGHVILFMNDTKKVAVNSGLTLAALGQKKDTKTTGLILKDAGKSDPKTSNVETLNDGPLTQYPYDITGTDINVTELLPETYHTLLGFLDVAKTNKSNVVVWNALTKNNTVPSGNYLDAAYLDAMNNYYLYSMGNVMYTAMTKVETDTELKLFVNTLIHAASKSMWVAEPAIIVNNGIMTVGGYNIYVDLDEIKLLAQSDLSTENVTAEKLREENYVIDFTAINYDGTSMDGYLYWVKDEATDTRVLLKDYLGTNQLVSGAMNRFEVTSLKGTLSTGDYEQLIQDIENEVAKFKIKAVNNDGLSEEKTVAFRQRKNYNLK